MKEGENKRERAIEFLDFIVLSTALGHRRMIHTLRFFLYQFKTQVTKSFNRSDPNHLARHSESGKKTRQTEEEVGRQHRARSGKTTSGNGQAWSSPSPRGRWRTGKNGGNWMRNHLWCPNDPRGLDIDGMR